MSTEKKSRRRGSPRLHGALFEKSATFTRIKSRRWSAGLEPKGKQVRDYEAGAEKVISGLKTDIEEFVYEGQEEEQEECDTRTHRRKS